MGDRYEISGTVHASLGNAVSDAIFNAIKAGIPTDEASCVSIQVAIDYFRGVYGDRAAERLPDLVRAMLMRPAPPPDTGRDTVAPRDTGGGDG